MLTSIKLSWPDSARWRAFLKFIVVYDILFFTIYFWAGHLAAQARKTYELYWAWERDIPLIPWMIWPYLSLLSLFVLPLFHMTPKQISMLSRQSTVTLVMAGAIFLLVPTQLGYAPVAVVGQHHQLFNFLVNVDTPHNLVPSLHVAIGALILMGCSTRTSPLLVFLYMGWLSIMAISTVLVHQHHIFDVISGLTLALFIRRFLPIGNG
jgi:membrane-associated phospholipid phosphatase